MQCFWEREVSNEKVLISEESYCEQYFMETHTRDQKRCYVVRLPIKECSLMGLGSSRQGAMQMLLTTERRLERNPSLKRYIDFINSYLFLSHMEQVSSK